MMEGNSSRSASVQADVGEVNSPEWRSQLQGGARQRIVNKIMDTLKKSTVNKPMYVDLGQLKKMAVRFEETMYTVATSQDDYLRKISVKMLTVEKKAQGGGVNGNPLSSTSGAANQNLIYVSWHRMMEGNSSRSAAVDAGEDGEGELMELMGQLEDEFRQQVLNSIMDTILLPISCISRKVKNFFAHFEENIYMTTTCPSDYLRDISMKMGTLQEMLQTKTSSAAIQNSSDPASVESTSQTIEPVPEWLEEIYPMILSMKEMYYPELSQKIGVKLQQSDYLRDITTKMGTLELMLQTRTSSAANQNSSDPASVESTSQTIEPVPEWLEEFYPKILSMKEMYYPELSQKIGVKLQQQYPLPPPVGSKQAEQLETMKNFKTELDQLIQILHWARNIAYKKDKMQSGMSSMQSGS